MTKPIKNPYVSSYSKYSHGQVVMFRYLIGSDIKFKVVCTATDKQTATKLARLLNKDWRERNGVEEQELVS